MSSTYRAGSHVPTEGGCDSACGILDLGKESKTTVVANCRLSQRKTRSSPTPPKKRRAGGVHVSRGEAGKESEDGAESPMTHPFMWRSYDSDGEAAVPQWLACYPRPVNHGNALAKHRASLSLLPSTGGDEKAPLYRYGISGARTTSKH